MGRDNSTLNPQPLPLHSPIPVIDLFAGPGGLGEGFSAYARDGKPAFHIRLSIEKDAQAHATLELRSFFRQFPRHRIPEQYYDFLRDANPRFSLASGSAASPGVALRLQQAFRDALAARW